MPHARGAAACRVGISAADASETAWRFLSLTVKKLLQIENKLLHKFLTLYFAHSGNLVTHELPPARQLRRLAIAQDQKKRPAFAGRFRPSRHFLANVTSLTLPRRGRAHFPTTEGELRGVGLCHPPI
jgi:hypothetical protein